MAETTFTRVLTDTRSIEPGALFVALAGERFDGHDYLDAAAAGQHTIAPAFVTWRRAWSARG